MASIEIQEIMYDHEGADDGFEWIEIYNNGSEDIDISSWHFYENEIHHGLTSDGFTYLEAGERALVVQNLENIYSEFGSSLKLIKSSFSLNNTGESLSISNQDKEIQSTVQYSSDDGAIGNGFSLQWNGSNWIEAEPTPGAVNTQTNQESSSSNSESSNSSRDNSSQQEKNIDFEEYYTGYINTSPNVVSGSPVTIEAYITHTTREKVIKKIKSGVYYLNFGDGSFSESGERIDTTHVYNYPGEYHLVFEFYGSDLARKSEEPPKVVVQKTLKVHENNIEIISIDSASTITLKNLTETDVNLEDWTIFYGTKEYTFPKYSYIKSGKTLIIPASAHNLEPIINNSSTILRNQKSIGVSFFTKNPSRVQSTQTELPSELETAISQEKDVIETKSQTNLEKFLSEHPEKEYADFNDTDIQSIPSNTSEETKSTSPTLPTLTIGVIALILVIIRKQYLSQKNQSEDNSKVAGEIELIE